MCHQASRASRLKARMRCTSLRTGQRAERLFALEHLIGEANTEAEGKLMDLMMMVITGGRERTRAEFAILLDETGFDIVSVTATHSMLSIIEAAPRL